MKVIEFKTMENGWREKITIMYDFKEELASILNHYGIQIGENRKNGLVFNVNDNGGELNVSITNINNFNKNIAYQVITDSEMAYHEYAKTQVKETIDSIKKVSQALSNLEIGA